MARLNSKTTFKVKRYSETRRGKRDKFRGRLGSNFNKLFELWKECGAESWAIVKWNNKVYLFNSNIDGRPPPKWNDLINKTYPVPEITGPLTFMDEASHNAGTITRSEPADQSEESEESDLEDASSGQTIRANIGSLRRLPALPALEVSPIQQRLAVWTGDKHPKA